MAGVAMQLTLSQAGEWLAKAADGTRDTTSLMKILSVAVSADAKSNFDQSRGPDDTPWAALRHPRPRGGSLPLRDTGLLMASVTGKGQGHIELVTESTLTYGTSLPYAAIHQYGGTIVPHGHPFLSIPATVEAVRAGGARNFPRPLSPRIGKRGGVLVEKTTNRRGQAVETVQYYLTRSVTIVARPFLGFGLRLSAKLEQLAHDWLERRFGSRG